jgi:hypothetical protein
LAILLPLVMKCHCRLWMVVLPPLTDSNSFWSMVDWWRRTVGYWLCIAKRHHVAPCACEAILFCCSNVSLASTDRDGTVQSTSKKILVAHALHWNVHRSESDRESTSTNGDTAAPQAASGWLNLAPAPSSPAHTGSSLLRG